MGAVKRFGTDEGGAVAIIFGLALLPIFGLMGGAVDYSRAAAEHSKLQRAVDATAVALIREPKTASASDLSRKGAEVFASLYPPTPGVTMDAPEVRREGRTIRLAASGRITNAFMQVLGFRDTGLKTTARAAWGQERLEIALVLDNTGSMRDLVGTKVKIEELRRWSIDFVDKLRREAADRDDVRVSVVPFDTEVRVQPNTYRQRNWLRWDIADRNAWTGYVVDRYQPKDITDEAPVAVDARYPAVTTSQWANSGNLPYVRPPVSLHDASAYDDIRATLGSMKPRGNTNVGLGVSWGTAMLTGSLPLDYAASADPRPVRRFMVVLTDGDNTQSWVNGTKVSAILPNGRLDKPTVDRMNERTAEACVTAKTAGIEMFTIRLLSGTVPLLQGCASPPNARIAQHYFDVQSDTELEKAFRSILDAISGTRLTH